MSINHPLFSMQQQFYDYADEQVKKSTLQLKTKKRKILDEVDKVKRLIDLAETTNGIEVDKYLETLEQIKRSVSQLDPNRESFNDLMQSMSKRRDSLLNVPELAGDHHGYYSEAHTNLRQNILSPKANSISIPASQNSSILFNAENKLQKVLERYENEVIDTE